MMFRLLLVCLLATASLAQTAESYRRRAIELSEKRSWAQAIESYHHAIALEPNDASTHYNLALALKYSGVPAQAVEEFQAALKLKPKWGDAHYGLGATFYDLQDLPAALKELRLAVELDPRNAAAHRFLARIYAQQNDSSDAERELTRALQLKPSAEIYFELGLVKGQLGNLPGAAASFRQCIRLNPNSEPPHLMLGVSLRRVGNHERALRRSKRAASHPRSSGASSSSASAT